MRQELQKRVLNKQWQKGMKYKTKAKASHFCHRPSLYRCFKYSISFNVFDNTLFWIVILYGSAIKNKTQEYKKHANATDTNSREEPNQQGVVCIPRNVYTYSTKTTCDKENNGPTQICATPHYKMKPL